MRQLAWCSILTACAGGVPEPIDAVPADVAPAVVTVRVDGQAREWFHADTPLAVGNAKVALDGARARPEVKSDTSGQFALDVPPGSIGYPITSKEGFLPTRNAELLVLEDAVRRDLQVVSDVQTRSMYLAAKGTPMPSGVAIVFADLREHGEPISGRTLADFALVSESGEPAGALGPFVVDAAGQLDLAATATAATFDDRAVITWLDCPAGVWRIALGGVQLPQRVICDAGGATLIDTARSDDPVIPTRPTFALDVYPRLQRPALDSRGLACTTCHHVQAVATGMVPIAYDGAPSVVLAGLRDRGLVNLDNPTESPILQRPLFEPPPAMQDHPNATLVDDRAFDYLVIRRWIEQGAVE